MQIPPTPQPSQDFQLSVSSRAQLLLRTGEIVQAEVLTVTETAVAIRMKNSIVEARTTLPLKEGDTILLKVEGWENELRLRLLPKDGSDIISLKNTILSAIATLKGAKPAAEDLKLLAALIKNMPLSLTSSLPELQTLEKLLPSLASITGGLLKDAIQDSGVFLETKLRLQVLQGTEGKPFFADQGQAAKSDLKAALLILRDALDRPDVADSLLRSGGKPASLAGAVDNLLRNIEVLQLQSRLNDTLQVFIPFVWQDLKEGELTFRESEQAREGDRAYSCTLNLDLERAGKLTAWALLQSGGIHVNIAAENEKFANLLQENAELLRIQFETTDLILGSLTIQQPGAVNFTSAHSNGLNIRI
jgi:hypothetical protein